MANLSIRRLDDEIVRGLKLRARRESTSMEEVARRILREAVEAGQPPGSTIRGIVGGDGVDLPLPAREVDEPVDFGSADYGDDGEP